MKNSIVISITGLGYVGLPLALAFSKHYKVIGFDKNKQRIDELQNGFDRTHETQVKDLNEANLILTSNADDLKQANFHIVAVPTPVDDANIPDLSILKNASKTLASALKMGDTVVFESTVYPGVTEEVCLPILSALSGLDNQTGFKLAYSPERINPGDKVRTLENVVKVVSGQDEATLELVAQVYGSIIKAGVYKASSIKVAEAAKVIENTQRDLNIALINELAIIFHHMDIDTEAVLKAAQTKWNFLPFKPGLVGGHCIGVDPYYLTYRAQQIGYQPEVILAGRRINNYMSNYIAQETIKCLIKQDVPVKHARVLVLGLTFKENCPDVRNSKSLDVIRELQAYGVNIIAHDPFADIAEFESHDTPSFKITAFDEIEKVDAIVLCVAHDFYKNKESEFIALIKEKGCIMDVKSALNPEKIKDPNVLFWRL